MDGVSSLPDNSEGEELRTPTGANSSTALCVGGRSIPLSTTLPELAAIFSDEWLASEIWPAATVLISAIEHCDSWRTLIQTAELVVDLGSGTGACGIAAAALGAQRVLLTDQPSALPLLQHNASCSGLSSAVAVSALEWQTEWEVGPPLPTGTNVVLASDCLNTVYGTTHAAALAGTMCALLRRGAPSAIGLMAQTARRKCNAEATFMAVCRARGLIVQPVDHAAPALDSEAGARVSLHEVRLC